MVLLAFAVTMAVAVVLSSVAHRTMLSSTLLFFAAGVCVGPEVFDALHAGPGTATVTQIATVSLFIVLVTDGTRVRLGELRRQWLLPGRALGLGIPVTLALIALTAHFVVGLGWIASFLVGAVLAPTDPVLASAIVGRERVPVRVRWLLNVESGANDGLVLPAVILLAAAISGAGPSGAGIAVALPAGVALGVAVPYAMFRLLRARPFGLSARAEPLAPASAALLVFAIAELTGANVFLAAFAAGITMGNLRDAPTERFMDLGEPLGEVAKLAAVFVFAALIPWSTYFTDGRYDVLLFAVVVLFVVRPVTIFVTMIGAGLSRTELTIAAWFGPRGMSSVVYALYVLQKNGAEGMRVFRMAGIVIAASILLHSSTDVPTVKWLSRRAADDEHEEAAARNKIVT